MPRRWRCTVCGYIHEGETPPDTCPVCGADRSQFVLIEIEHPSLVREIASHFQLHAVAAHFPGGLIPTGALFVTLSLLTKNRGLDDAAYWLLLVVAAALPVSVVSGVYDWQTRFDGQRAAIFFKKISLAATLGFLVLIALFLRFNNPDLLIFGGWQYWLYLLCFAGMLVCVTLLGHFGGRLASQKAKPEQS